MSRSKKTKEFARRNKMSYQAADNALRVEAAPKAQDGRPVEAVLGEMIGQMSQLVGTLAQQKAFAYPDYENNLVQTYADGKISAETLERKFSEIEDSVRREVALRSLTYNAKIWNELTESKRQQAIQYDRRKRLLSGLTDATRSITINEADLPCFSGGDFQYETHPIVLRLGYVGLWWMPPGRKDPGEGPSGRVLEVKVSKDVPAGTAVLSNVSEWQSKEPCTLAPVVTILKESPGLAPPTPHDSFPVYVTALRDHLRACPHSSLSPTTVPRKLLFGAICNGCGWTALIRLAKVKAGGANELRGVYPKTEEAWIEFSERLERGDFDGYLRHEEAVESIARAEDERAFEVLAALAEKETDPAV